MQVFFAPLAAMAVFICFSSSAGRAELLRSIPPAGAAVSEAAVKSLPAPTGQELGPLIKQTKPVFIFLPGILGSKLSRMVNGKDEPFWGTPRAFLGDDPAFRYDATDHVSAQVLDDIYVRGSSANRERNSQTESRV